MVKDVLLAEAGMPNSCYWDADTDPSNPGWVYRVECPDLGLIECQPCSSIDEGMAMIRQYGRHWIELSSSAGG